MIDNNKQSIGIERRTDEKMEGEEEEEEMCRRHVPDTVT